MNDAVGLSEMGGLVGCLDQQDDDQLLPPRAALGSPQMQLQLHQPSLLFALEWVSPLVALVLLAVEFFILEPMLPQGSWPFTEQTQWLYAQPGKADTVPSATLFPICFAFVLSAMALEVFGRRCGTRHDRVVMAVNFALIAVETFAFTTLLTNLGKVAVRELRPDFRSRCLGSHNSLNYTVNPDGTIKCTGKGVALKDGHLSFPSGHSSVSMCIGLLVTLYLVWFTYHRTVVTPWRTGPVYHSLKAKILTHAAYALTLFPVFVSLFVCASRVYDHRHSPGDVAAGALLGSVMASLGFIRVLALEKTHTGVRKIR